MSATRTRKMPIKQCWMIWRTRGSIGKQMKKQNQRSMIGIFQIHQSTKFWIEIYNTQWLNLFKFFFQPILEGYQSGYNGAVLKTVCLKVHGSSNLPPSTNNMLPSSISQDTSFSSLEDEFNFHRECNLYNIQRKTNGVTIYYQKTYSVFLLESQQNWLVHLPVMEKVASSNLADFAPKYYCI